MGFESVSNQKVVEKKVIALSQRISSYLGFTYLRSKMKSWEADEFCLSLPGKAENSTSRKRYYFARFNEKAGQGCQEGPTSDSLLEVGRASGDVLMSI